MASRLLLSYAAIIATVSLACSPADRRASDHVSVYELVSVGGQPLNPMCSDEELRSSRYELSGDRWISVDTVFKECADSLRPEFTRVRADTGVFALHGDTIQFENPNANLKLGEARVVLMGLLRRDTLIARGSDEDGGDYVFVRRTLQR